MQLIQSYVSKTRRFAHKLKQPLTDFLVSQLESL